MMKLSFPANAQARAEDVAHIDELKHFGLQRMRIRAKPVAVHLNPFGPDGNTRALTHFRDIDGLGINLLTPVQLDQAFAARQSV